MSRGCVSNEWMAGGRLIVTSENPANPYTFMVLVDEQYTSTLKLFKWNKINTKDGTYFGAAANINAFRKCIEPLNLPFENGKQLLLHRLLAHLYKLPNEHEYKYVDHISRETLDNRSVNLRWASQSQQNNNTGKRTRKVGARELPGDIELPLPKYVNWCFLLYKGCLKPSSYFSIEKHPALGDKKWCTQKRQDMTNQEKLDQAKQKLIELDKLVDPDPDKDLREHILKEYTALIKA
jgi:hypothetical protein